MWSVICGLSFCCSQITSCFCQADIYINRITSFKILNWTLTGAIQWLLMNSTHLSSESKELVNFSPFGLVTDIANLVQTNGMVYHRLFSDLMPSYLLFFLENPIQVQFNKSVFFCNLLPNWIGCLVQISTIYRNGDLQLPMEAKTCTGRDLLQNMIHSNTS